MPPWPSIDTIMFDMDGTLLDLHFDNYFWLNLVPQNYAKNNGISEDEALNVIRSKYEEVHGTLDWYCLDHWEKELQLDIPELKTQIKHKIRIRPNAENLLRELRFSDKKLLQITNAHPKSLQIKMSQTGIDEFYLLCVSSRRHK